MIKGMIKIMILSAFLSGCSIGMDDEIADVIATEKTFPSETRESAPDTAFLIRQATNEEQYIDLWNHFDFQEKAPEVDFDENNVLFFYLTESGSCPKELTGEDIQVNPDTGTLELEPSITGDTEEGCTADSTPRTFVIELTQNIGPINSVIIRHIDGEYTVPVN